MSEVAAAAHRHGCRVRGLRARERGARAGAPLVLAPAPPPRVRVVHFRTGSVSERGGSGRLGGWGWETSGCQLDRSVLVSRSARSSGRSSRSASRRRPAASTSAREACSSVGAPSSRASPSYLELPSAAHRRRVLTSRCSRSSGSDRPVERLRPGDMAAAAGNPRRPPREGTVARRRPARRDLRARRRRRAVARGRQRPRTERRAAGRRRGDRPRAVQPRRAVAARRLPCLRSVPLSRGRRPEGFDDRAGGCRDRAPRRAGPDRRRNRSARRDRRVRARGRAPAVRRARRPRRGARLARVARGAAAGSLAGAARRRGGAARVEPVRALDAGFQLSFAAVARDLRRRASRRPRARGLPAAGSLAQPSAVSAACGLATAPVSWFQFQADPARHGSGERRRRSRRRRRCSGSRSLRRSIAPVAPPVAAAARVAQRLGRVVSSLPAHGCSGACRARRSRPAAGPRCSAWVRPAGCLCLASWRTSAS